MLLTEAGQNPFPENNCDIMVELCNGEDLCRLTAQTKALLNAATSSVDVPLQQPPPLSALTPLNQVLSQPGCE